MIEIEDRELIFKSYKSYAKFLNIEIRKLQQLLPSSDVKNCYYGAKRDYEVK